MSPDPLESGESETQRAPTLERLEARSARNFPSARSASSTSVTRSRPWESERKASDREAVNFTGRPSLQEAQSTRPYSTYTRFFDPKLPPTSRETTRSFSGSIPRSEARPFLQRTAPPLPA